jgi:large subunit ribosomal protein L7/L12
MAISKEDILEAVGALTVMELNDLVKAFEEKFGVSAAAVAVAGPAAGAAAAVEEKTWNRTQGSTNRPLPH